MFSAGLGSGFYPSGHWMAAKQAMGQVYPRPDVETASFARHRWAYYDGSNPVQYVVPVGVNFGAYPYVFSLTGPAGMTIGTVYGSTNYGVVTWTPSGSVTNATVTVTVTDQQLNTLTVTWTVSTSSSTTHFIFIDSVNGNDSTGTGTITNPWASLSKAFGSTFAASINGGAICYVRAGTYVPPAYADNDINGTQPYFEMNTTTKPASIVAFPGDTQPVFTMTNCSIATFHNAPDFFLQGVGFSGYFAGATDYWGIYIASPTNMNRLTVDSISWTGRGYGTAGTNVASMLFCSAGGGAYRQYVYLRNLSESNLQSGTPGNNYAGPVCYAIRDSLIEGCTFNVANNDGICYSKADGLNVTIRGNFATTASCPHFCSVGFNQSNTPQNIESCYNKLIWNGTGSQPAYILADQAGTFGTLWCYRNSAIGFYNSFSANAGGPFVFESNIAQTSNSPAFPTGTSIQTDGLDASATSGVLDGTTCNLTGSFLVYLGTRGAQIA